MGTRVPNQTLPDCASLEADVSTVMTPWLIQRMLCSSRIPPGVSLLPFSPSWYLYLFLSVPSFHHLLTVCLRILQPFIVITLRKSVDPWPFSLAKKSPDFPSNMLPAWLIRCQCLLPCGFVDSCPWVLRCFCGDRDESDPHGFPCVNTWWVSGKD